LDDRAWRNLSIVLGVICVLLLFLVGAAIMTLDQPSSNPTPIVVRPTTTPAGPTPSGSAPTAIASTTGQPRVTPTPKPTQQWPTVAITFSNLMLDAQNDTAHTLRTFTFVSDGPGPVAVKVDSSTGGTVRACLSVDLGKEFCTEGAKPRFTGALAAERHNLWTVTLIGKGAATPTIEVTISWPTANASITLAHGRFQGVPTANSERGFTASFKPRGAGELQISSAWPGMTAEAELTLADVTGSTPVIIDDKNYSAATSISPPYTTSVVPSVKYQVLVLNKSPDAGRPDMSATISFP
jgi:hypothetical protein